MRYYLDTEFIEYPCTIDLISIGIVAEDGRRFYAISSEFDESKACPWVQENVIAQLDEQQVTQVSKVRMPRAGIRECILNFIAGSRPEFWGYYADYDWVVFCWLFGRMVDLPKGWPKYCRDLKQLLDHLGDKRIPFKPDQEHNALSDAKWNKRVHDWVDGQV